MVRFSHNKNTVLIVWPFKMHRIGSSWILVFVRLGALTSLTICSRCNSITKNWSYCSFNNYPCMLIQKLKTHPRRTSCVISNLCSCPRLDRTILSSSLITLSHSIFLGVRWPSLREVRRLSPPWLRLRCRIGLCSPLGSIANRRRLPVCNISGGIKSSLNFFVRLQSIVNQLVAIKPPE